MTQSVTATIVVAFSCQCAPYNSTNPPPKGGGILFNTENIQMNNTYRDMVELESYLLADLKNATIKPVEQQNQEYIDRLKRTINAIEQLKVYY